MKREIEDVGGLIWITQGREVENYIDPEALHKSIKKVHSNSYVSSISVGRYDEAIAYKSNKLIKGTYKRTANKVRVAEEVVKSEPSLDKLDLRTQIKLLASAIRTAKQA